VRQQALRRDDWRCVRCGSRHGLEIDHIQPVRDRPDLGFSLDNLQTLCGRCHAAKTRVEVGHAPLPPARKQWRDLLMEAKCLSP
jgi:5-methylcytosine-specific restriction endonuclease McrA